MASSPCQKKRLIKYVHDVKSHPSHNCGSPRTGEGTLTEPLLQFSSSDLSLQSGPPSQRQLEWMHSPLRQWNSKAEQGLSPFADVWRSPQCCGHSSELSSQSGSSSQTHSSGMQVELLHWKLAGPQVDVGQEASSEPSKQSSSESQTKLGKMHFPSWQRNSSWEHVLGAAGPVGEWKMTNRSQGAPTSQHQPSSRMGTLSKERPDPGEWTLDRQWQRGSWTRNHCLAQPPQLTMGPSRCLSFIYSCLRALL